MGVTQLEGAFVALATREGVDTFVSHERSDAYLTLRQNGREFTVRTDGGEAFLTTIDSGLSRLDFEWDEDSQMALVERLAQVGVIYILGGGVATQRKGFFRKARMVLRIDLGDEQFEFS